ncbi:hypothetical protein EK904_007484, partial [Melospiza melodia maxima]
MSSATQISVCASGAAWRDRNCSTPQIDEPSDADLLYMAATLEPRHIWSGVSLLRNRGQLQPEPAEPSAALKGSPPASPSLLPGVGATGRYQVKLTQTSYLILRILT